MLTGVLRGPHLILHSLDLPGQTRVPRKAPPAILQVVVERAPRAADNRCLPRCGAVRECSVLPVVLPDGGVDLLEAQGARVGQAPRTPLTSLDRVVPIRRSWLWSDPQAPPTWGTFPGVFFLGARPVCAWCVRIA